MSILIYLIAGARPNFMKVAPLYRVLKAENWCVPELIHTGQHYSRDMSGNLIDEFELPEPKYNLNVGSSEPAEQIAKVMLGCEKIFIKDRPRWVVVVGDVNSTVGAALAAKKQNIPVVHVEAGLRSWDDSMPEELNRIVTDSISDFLFTPSAEADENLLREGKSAERIIRVGNIMIDAYEIMKPKIASANIVKKMNLKPKNYGIVTLHRPAFVDSPTSLREVIKILEYISAVIDIVFPVHPRTENQLRKNGLWEKILDVQGLRILAPVGYMEFMSLVKSSKFVITDSGGLQEETTFLGIPCLTLRNNTERPVTVDLGTNQLVGLNDLTRKVSDILDGNPKAGTIPPLWDGNTARRIADKLKQLTMQGA